MRRRILPAQCSRWMRSLLGVGVFSWILFGGVHCGHGCVLRAVRFISRRRFGGRVYLEGRCAVRDRVCERVLYVRTRNMHSMHLSRMCGWNIRNQVRRNGWCGLGMRCVSSPARSICVDGGVLLFVYCGLVVVERHGVRRLFHPRLLSRDYSHPLHLNILLCVHPVRRACGGGVDQRVLVHLCGWFLRRRQRHVCAVLGAELLGRLDAAGLRRVC